MAFTRLLQTFGLKTLKDEKNKAQKEYDADPNPCVHPETEHPDIAWKLMTATQTVKRVSPMDMFTPIADDKVRFVCLSDTHNQHIDVSSLPEGDVFLHAGDFTNSGKLREINQFNEFLGSLPYKHKIVIAGNHELTFDPNTRSFNGDVQTYMNENGLQHPCELLTNATVYLEDSLTTVYGIKIYGAPWQPEFGGWGFNLKRGEELLEKWNKIPDKVDVLMTHGPPIGHGDANYMSGRCGCVELLSTIQKRVKPKYHLFGHIHEDYGITTDGFTTFINASTCTLRYKANNPAIVFDLPLPEGERKDISTGSTMEDSSDSLEIVFEDSPSENSTFHRRKVSFCEGTDVLNEETDNDSVEHYPESHLPTKAWKVLSGSQNQVKVKPMDTHTPIKDDKVRFVCLSDTHNQEIDPSSLPAGDVFLHSGDFTNSGQLQEIMHFNEFLGKLPYQHKIVIAGNHELSFDPENKYTHPTEMTDLQQYMTKHNIAHPHQLLTNASVYLQDAETSVCGGIRIYGSPWQPEKSGWAFNLMRGKALMKKWNKIPAGVDVLMTHGPPVGYGDKNFDNGRSGCVDLLRTIQERVHPKYHVYGHVHEGYGITTDGETTFINAATCNRQQKPVHPPIVFDLPLSEGARKSDPPTEPITAISDDEDSCDESKMETAENFMKEFELQATEDHEPKIKDIESGETSKMSKRGKVCFSEKVLDIDHEKEAAYASEVLEKEKDDEMEESACDMEDSACDMEDSVCDMEDSACDMENTAGKIEVHRHTDHPDTAWRMLAVKQEWEKITPMDYGTPVFADKIRFVCLSDTHNKLIDVKKMPPGDVFLHAGDFTMNGAIGQIQEFNKLLGELPYKHKIVIAGNHELSFDPMTMKNPRYSYLSTGVNEYLEVNHKHHPKELLTNATVYLEDSETTVNGIRVYGSPWQPEFGEWAFNLERGQDLLDKWDKIPEGVDILMTHGPPVGHGDSAGFSASCRQHTGCVELLATIQRRVKPKYHVFGHIHEGYGVSTDGVTTYINASTCNRKYRPDNPPVVFDLPLPEGHSK